MSPGERIELDPYTLPPTGRRNGPGAVCRPGAKRSHAKEGGGHGGRRAAAAAAAAALGSRHLAPVYRRLVLHAGAVHPTHPALCKARVAARPRLVNWFRCPSQPLPGWGRRSPRCTWCGPATGACLQRGWSLDLAFAWRADAVRMHSPRVATPHSDQPAAGGGQAVPGGLLLRCCIMPGTGSALNPCAGWQRGAQRQCVRVRAGRARKPEEGQAAGQQAAPPPAQATGGTPTPAAPAAWTTQRLACKACCCQSSSLILITDCDRPSPLRHIPSTPAFNLGITAVPVGVRGGYAPCYRPLPAAAARRSQAPTRSCSRRFGASMRRCIGAQGSIHDHAPLWRSGASPLPAPHLHGHRVAHCTSPN